MGKAQTAEVKRLEKREDVKAALEQTGVQKEPPKPRFRRGDRFWLVAAAAGLVGFTALYLFLRTRTLSIGGEVVKWPERCALGLAGMAAVVTAMKIIEIFLIGRLRSTVGRYNLRRVIKLLTGLALIVIVISVLFVSWYTAVVSLGLVSLILGFALQTPITSFIGWIYILVRTPYRVGDRIKIGDATGDVIDVSYLDTTLWEFGGQYLSTDHPSGRVIKFPNSNILNAPVWNYSWPLFPYIWNEIKLQIAYDSDMEFVAKTMLKIAKEHIGEEMTSRVKVFRELLAQTPVDHLEVHEEPTVYFRVSENTWLEAILRYLVHPKEAGRVKTQLIRKLLPELNASPDRVLFPKSNMR